MNFFNRLFLVGFAIILITNFAFSQTADNTFKYQAVSQNMVSNYYSPKNLKGSSEGGVFASKYLTGKESPHQATQILQRLIDKNSKVILPNQSLTISTEGLSLKSNSILVFQGESQLKIIDNNLDYYQLLKIHNVTNVKIYNANIKGDRNGHKSKTGEWGYGISIRESKNVVIENSRITDFWGDGIAIGYSNTGTSEGIVIKNAFLDNNRRNGISVMNVNGLLLENVYVANTHGTLPMFGIDFEPNNASDNLNNIKLNNVYTFNNLKGGLMITFNNLKPKSAKNINFEISNFTDKNSHQGILIAGIPKEAYQLRGNIKLFNITLDGNDRPITGRTIYNNAVNVDIKDLNITNPKNKNVTHSEVNRVFKTKKNYSIRFKN